MASTSASSCNTGCQQENEHTNASEGIVPSPSTSVTASMGSLFSSCFSWFSFLVSLCSTKSHSVPLTSASSIRVRDDCEGISPSPSATHAFEQVTPSPSTSGRSTMPEGKLPYDIFINHRGPDAKKTLATDLYNTLNGMGLRVFLDSQELELGDFLPTEIEEVMRRASLHIAILSPRYAQSPWCLAELSFMLKTRTPIVPIFYHIEPADVRHAKGVYAEAFSEHQKKGRYTSEKLQDWKNALNNVSYNVGGIIHNEDDEGSLLMSIINHVLKMIKNVPFVVAKHPIGLDEAVIDFERTFQSEESSHTVQIVGIWGMGGSGKTTLAKQFFNNKYTTMEKSSFLFDVREAASKSVLHDKQKKLLEDLGLHGLSLDNIEEGKGILANRLRSVRVLIILDDVDNEDQLDALVPNKNSLGWGSLIVVTTRELEVLQQWGISSIYKMKLLDPLHAKQLFCWHAFLKPTPLQEFEDLVESFLKVCNGLPLSLKIFGAQLYGKSSKDYWKTQLHKISRILHKDVKDRLKISYDALDDEEKQIFLDTACFFIGEKKTSAIAAWDGSGWSGQHSCERLLNKCFIELDDDDCIRMHDHLRDLGREIANHQSPHRLWSTQQIINIDSETQRIGIRGIMATTTGCTSEVEEISLCFQGRKIRVNTNRGYYSFTPSLLGLKILHVRGNYFNQVIADISKDLVWLRWFAIGHNNLGSLGSLKKLRVLELYGKKFSNHFSEELWETDGDAPVQLRELVISECHNFQRFPKSIGFLKDLQKLVLTNEYGNEMKNLPKEFCLLQSLEHLELSGCQKLSSLPSSFGQLRNLRHIDLSGCEELKKLPVSFKELTLLQHLNLKGCSKLTLESDILENMMKLENLDLSNCERLEELPRHITNQVSLRELHLYGIRMLREIPMNISQLSKLKVMEIGSELLTSLPTSLGDLCSLTSLIISECPKLECVPDTLGHLNLLEYLEISNSGVKSLPQSTGQLNNLQRLDIHGCPISQLDLRAWLFASSLCSLKQINLSRTEVSKISIPRDCCPGLRTIFIDYNKHLTEIEILPSTVESIRLMECKMVRSIWGIDGLVNMQWLMITDCPKLDALPNFAQFSSLRVFELRGCYRVKKIHGLEHCTALEELTAETRWKEAGIECLERMERLRIVNLTATNRSSVEGCIQSMQNLPDKILICTRAVPDASSFVNFVSNYLSVINSNDKQNMSFNADGTLVCFVVECQSPKTNLLLMGGNVGCYKSISWAEVEKGKWVWIALFSQFSEWHNEKVYHVSTSPGSLEGAFSIPIRHQKGTIPLSFNMSQSPVNIISTVPSYEVEIAYAVGAKMERLVEAFKFLWQTVPN
ncbi:TMV resistance protein N isoform X2 [Cryptomeria japonica]|uniref:TMV resistance protein N isoform X2 n=1 Tax=Cryptomeria japonica TaxID=3369 RepID=UPI0025AB98D0|nr:TMV resistance protein N isoform X2 [Cryptomeria japonica]